MLFFKPFFYSKHIYLYSGVGVLPANDLLSLSSLALCPLDQVGNSKLPNKETPRK